MTRLGFVGLLQSTALGAELGGLVLAMSALETVIILSGRNSESKGEGQPK
jgi:hypothetical protein